MNKKLLIIGIIVAVAVIVGGGIFLVKSKIPNYKQIQNSNTEITNWKTYANEKYNYTLKYPDATNFRILDMTGCLGMSSEDANKIKGARVFIREELSSTKSGTVPTEDLDIEVIDPKLIPLSCQTDDMQKIYALPLEEFVTAFRNHDEKAYKKTGDVTETFIDGQKAYQFSLTFFSQYDYIVFVNPENNFKTIIGFSPTNKNAIDILSTFKFTK